MQNLVFKGLNGQFKIVAATQYITRIKDSTNKREDVFVPSDIGSTKFVPHKLSFTVSHTHQKAP